MAQRRYRVAIIGCGRMGQQYAEAYQAYPDTEIVALAEYNPERRRIVGERFGVRALYPDAAALLRDVVPDIAAIVTPAKYTKEAVIACAEAGVKGVSADKPLAAVLADADEMVEACAARNIVFSGGNLQRAMHEVQEAAARLHAGEYGPLRGACVHRYGLEISGGGCQHISILRLFTGAEVAQVMAWGGPPEALDAATDEGLAIHGHFRMTSGLECLVFGVPTPHRGVDVWTDQALVRWDWAPPEVYLGVDAQGCRRRLEVSYQPYAWSEFSYLTGSIRSLLAAVETGLQPWISGHDLRQALEVAIAARLSARQGSVPVSLPLADRSLSLYPAPYRWLGGDDTGCPQSLDEAAGRVVRP